MSRIAVASPQGEVVGPYSPGVDAGGLDESHIQKVTVFLTDMADFAAMNAVYQTRFSRPYPARSAVAVAALPLGARVEIELIARR